MFHGTIYQGIKNQAVFEEKKLKKINSIKYDQFILRGIEALV